MEKLSAREYEVLLYLIQGLTNKEIAKKLDITISTVKIHISSIKEKLRASNRTSILYIVLKNKIVDINKM